MGYLILISEKIDKCLRAFLFLSNRTKNLQYVLSASEVGNYPRKLTALVAEGYRLRRQLVLALPQKAITNRQLRPVVWSNT